EVNFSTGW
nr:adipokinetic hormone [Acheta domesticus]prf//1813270A adipokinetic hormone [Acheta domesticus]